MAEIQFEEEQQFTRPVQAAKPSLLVRFVYFLGLASTEAQAQRVLLIMAVVIGALAIALQVFPIPF